MHVPDLCFKNWECVRKNGNTFRENIFPKNKQSSIGFIKGIKKGCIHVTWLVQLTLFILYAIRTHKSNDWKYETLSLCKEVERKSICGKGINDIVKWKHTRSNTEKMGLMWMALKLFHEECRCCARWNAGMAKYRQRWLKEKPDVLPIHL